MKKITLGSLGTTYIDTQIGTGLPRNAHQDVSLPMKGVERIRNKPCVIIPAHRERFLAFIRNYTDKDGDPFDYLIHINDYYPEINIDESIRELTLKQIGHNTEIIEDPEFAGTYVLVAIREIVPNPEKYTYIKYEEAVVGIDHTGHTETIIRQNCDRLTGQLLAVIVPFVEENRGINEVEMNPKEAFDYLNNLPDEIYFELEERIRYRIFDLDEWDGHLAKVDKVHHNRNLNDNLKQELLEHGKPNIIVLDSTTSGDIGDKPENSIGRARMAPIKAMLETANSKDLMTEVVWLDADSYFDEGYLDRLHRFYSSYKIEAAFALQRIIFDPEIPMVDLVKHAEFYLNRVIEQLNGSVDVIGGPQISTRLRTYTLPLKARFKGDQFVGVPIIDIINSKLADEDWAFSGILQKALPYKERPYLPECVNVEVRLDARRSVTAIAGDSANSAYVLPELHDETRAGFKDKVLNHLRNRNFLLKLRRQKSKTDSQKRINALEQLLQIHDELVHILNSQEIITLNRFINLEKENFTRSLQNHGLSLEAYLQMQEGYFSINKNIVFDLLHFMNGLQRFIVYRRLVQLGYQYPIEEILHLEES